MSSTRYGTQQAQDATPARTVNRGIVFRFTGRSGSAGPDFTPRGQQPAADLFAKAEEYFGTGSAPATLSCWAPFANTKTLLSITSLEGANYEIRSMATCAWMSGGGVVYVQNSSDFHGTREIPSTVTRNTALDQTVVHELLFKLIGHSDSSWSTFMSQTQQPAEGLFAKAEEYFGTQASDVLYCWAPAMDSRFELHKDDIDAVNRCLTHIRFVAKMAGEVVYIWTSIHERAMTEPSPGTEGSTDILLMPLPAVRPLARWPIPWSISTRDLRGDQLPAKVSPTQPAVVTINAIKVVLHGFGQGKHTIECPICIGTEIEENVYLGCQMCRKEFHLVCMEGWLTQLPRNVNFACAAW